jgi:hypothetical protein
LSWELSDEQFEAVSRERDTDRHHEYFVGRATSFGEVWMLARGDDLLIIEETRPRDADAIPAWPHRRYAEAWLEAEQPGDGWEPWCCEVHDFVDRLLGSFIEDGTEVAVMAMPDGSFVPATARELRSRMDAALDAEERD